MQFSLLNVEDFSLYLHFLHGLLSYLPVALLKNPSNQHVMTYSISYVSLFPFLHLSLVPCLFFSSQRQ